MRRSVLTLLAATMLAISATTFAQNLSPTPSAPASPQTQAMQSMPQMGDMESMKRMADMCQEMMQKEKAAMPFIIGTSVVFGLLLFIALVLLIVLEVQWIIYWKHLLRTKAANTAR